MNITLTQHNFLTSVTASTVGPWVGVDWQYSGIQNRTIMGRRESSASDEIIVEVRSQAVNTAGTTVEVIATATVWTGAGTTFSAVIWGAFDAIRVRKVGSSAAATVNGII